MTEPEEIMTFEFKLPDIGEGLTEGEIVKWQVKEGDAVKENQPLVDILTDKAEVEIPSPKSGKIIKLFAKEGQKVKVGETLVSFEVAGGSSLQPPAQAPAKTPAPAPVAANGHAERPSATKMPDHALVKTADAPFAPSVNAMPAVRKLAEELKVDLARISGTGPGGRITEDDVRKAAKPASGAPKPSPESVKPLVEAAKPSTETSTGKVTAGLEERVPFTGIRRRTAEKISAANLIPQVTHVDEADYTALIELRGQMIAEAERRGIKLTFLPFVLAALVKALKEFPNLNSTLDEAGQAIVQKRYYNIGVAIDTPQGLVVPVIKNAEAKTVWDMAIHVNRLADKARANKLELAELQDGTFTVTNIGPVGGMSATPLIYPSQTGILAVMKIQERPVVRNGSVVVRQVGNLCLSFDHRVLDGAEAARFTNTLIKHVENPRTLL